MSYHDWDIFKSFIDGKYTLNDYEIVRFKRLGLLIGNDHIVLKTVRSYIESYNLNLRKFAEELSKKSE